MVTAVVAADENAVRFLIECLNIRRDPRARQAAGDYAETYALDWDDIWRLAKAERIAPLLYHTTRGMGVLPSWLIEHCHAEYLETGIQNTLRMREVGQILRELCGAGIPVMALKGVALAERIYGNMALRPMMDIDLLVRPEDAPRTLSVLENCGYQQEGPEIAAGAALTYENELLLRKQDNQGWPLELHWSLFNSPFHQQQLTSDDLWNTAVSLTIDEVPALMPSIEWMLLHLCGHLALHHLGSGLLWWNDLADIFNQLQEEIDWDELLILSQRNHLILPLKHILNHSVEYWRAPVPEEILARVRLLPPALEEQRYIGLITRGDRPPAKRLLDDVAAISSWRAKAKFATRNILPAADYMDERYNIRRPCLRIFYYLYRWYLGLSGLVRSGLQGKGQGPKK